MKTTGLFAAMHKNLWPLLVLAVGLAVRLFLPFLGHNYDFESFWIVGEITAQFKNVYVETARYNYGPIWFGILFLFRQLAALLPGSDLNTFRWCIVLLLCVTDVSIFLMLQKKFGLWAAGLFFLNPVSMIITGYHNQFDNIAIALGLAAGLLLEKQPGANIRRHTAWGLVLLGLSITTKHLFIFFPVWLMLQAVSQKRWLRAFIVLLIPYGIFLLSFLPFTANGGFNGILANVFQYKSFNNAPFFRMFIPPVLQAFTTPMQWLITCMALAGILLRKSGVFNRALIYLGVLVTFAPAMTNQYLAIPSAFIAVFPNPFFVIYVLIGTYHLLVNLDGLHLQAVREIFYPASYHFFFEIAIIALAAGLFLFILLYNHESLAKRLGRLRKPPAGRA